MEEIYRKAFRKWGSHNQVGILQEECAELIVASSKWFRGDSPAFEYGFIEELADVEIMIEQMKLIIDQNKFNEIKTTKIKRLIK